MIDLTNITALELMAYGDFDMIHTEGIFIGPKTTKKALLKLLAPVYEKCREFKVTVELEEGKLILRTSSYQTQQIVKVFTRTIQKAGFVKLKTMEITITD